MNIIFDFDGTICDSFSVLVKIYNEKLPQYSDLNITLESVRQKGVKQIIAESGISTAAILKLIIAGQKEMARYLPSLSVFPNLPPVLNNLAGKHNLGIITTNSESNVKAFLKNNGLENFFNFVYSEINLFGKHRKIKKVMKKFNFDPEETYYVGDETRDVEAAKRVGIKSVAVTWGYESPKILLQSHPDVLVNKPTELLNIWK